MASKSGTAGLISRQQKEAEEYLSKIKLREILQVSSECHGASFGRDTGIRGAGDAYYPINLTETADGGGGDTARRSDGLFSQGNHQDKD